MSPWTFEGGASDNWANESGAFAGYAALLVENVFGALLCESGDSAILLEDQPVPFESGLDGNWTSEAGASGTWSPDAAVSGGWSEESPL